MNLEKVPQYDDEATFLLSFSEGSGLLTQTVKKRPHFEKHNFICLMTKYLSKNCHFFCTFALFWHCKLSGYITRGRRFGLLNRKNEQHPLGLPHAIQKTTKQRGIRDKLAHDLY